MKAGRSTRTFGYCLLALPLLLQSALSIAQTPRPDSIQQRKDQLAADTAKLLKLATELKAAVDKSTKDQLSIAVVKKAGEVEKLARKVREELKTSVNN